VNTPKKIAIYGRVSTTDQKVESQVQALRQLAFQRSWHVVDEYLDAGVSGLRDRRPALDRLMADAHKRKFSAVVVWRFDRFGRSLRHLVTALDEFRDLGINFISMEDSIDTGTASGRMLYGVIGAMAQFESELNRERTILGLQAAKRRGVKLGRKPVTFDIDLAHEMRSSGRSFRAIASALSVSVGLVHRVLTTPKRAFICPRRRRGYRSLICRGSGAGSSVHTTFVRERVLRVASFATTAVSR